MTIISNHTEDIVVIYNNVFSTNLCANATVDISEDVLNKNSELHFRFLGAKETYKKIDCGLEKGGIRKRSYFKYEVQSHIPIEAVLNVKNIAKVVLEAETISLRKLLLFKTIYIKKILCKCMPSELGKTQYLFLNIEDKRHFLKMMRLGCAVTFPAALLAIVIMILELFSSDTFMEKMTVLFFLLGFTIVALEDFYYTVKASKWEISQEHKGTAHGADKTS